MVGRATTFSDPQIIETLSTKFVCAAIDQAYHRRQKDAEGEFFRKIARQGPVHDFENGTSQGLYACAPDGTLLFYNNNYGVERHRRLLARALEQYRPAETPELEAGRRDPQWDLRPPEGGLVVRVTAKVLGGYGPPADEHERIYQESLGRDRLWIQKAEAERLARGELPEAVARRIARFHLEDNTRGEPSFWEAEDVRALRLALADGRLSGSVRLETPDGRRGYEAQLLGFVEAKEGKVTRFDVVARGDYWGEGRWTPGAPKGRFPLAVAFTLATGDDEADKVAPQAARGYLRGYYR